MPNVTISVPDDDLPTIALLNLIRNMVETRSTPALPAAADNPIQGSLQFDKPNARKMLYNQHRSYKVQHPATDLLLDRHQDAIRTVAHRRCHVGMVRVVLDLLATRYGMSEFKVTGPELARDLGFTTGPVEQALGVLHQVGVVKYTANRSLRRIDWMA